MKKAYFWLGILIILFSGVFASVSPRTAFAATSDHFSLILLPDTQNYVLSFPDRSAILENQVSWILDNQQSQKIAFVMQEGDMTNENTQLQWDKFTHAIKRMDGKVPYALTVGNHDRIGETGWAYTNFNNNFKVSDYSGYTYFGGTFKPGQLQNAYYLFSAGGRDWLVLSLAYGMPKDVLDWAGDIADRYASRHVIVLTHCYMYFDSNAGSAFDNTRFGQVVSPTPPYSWMCSPNNGQQIWDKFIKLHKNVTFVFSGHTLGSGVGRRMDEGTYGNQVYQMLANYQMQPKGGDGYLRIVDIYPDDKIFKVKTYSPYTNLYKTDADNQFQYTSVNSLNPIPVPTSKPDDIWGKKVGVDYHAATSDFSKSAFFTQYHEPGVRDTVRSQIQSMADSGAKIIRTSFWPTDPPGHRQPELHERLGHPLSTQELQNIRQYVQDVSTVKTTTGSYVDLYMAFIWNGCSKPDAYFLYPAVCDQSWSNLIATDKKSITDFFTAVGNITRPDGKKAVKIVYFAAEVMIGAKGRENQGLFLIDLYPHFISQANQYGITPSLYFLIVPEESSILDDNHIDSKYPVLNGHRSLYWIYRSTEFLRQNNLPVPSRLDFSLYPKIVNSNYDTLVKRVFDDLAAVYPTKQFGVAETYYPTTSDKRRALGSAFTAELTRRNLLQEVFFWTTPNSGEDGSNAGFPFNFISYYPQTLIADINADRKVDTLDYNLLISNFGKTGLSGWISSDIIENGKVDLFDYNILVGNFGI